MVDIAYLFWISWFLALFILGLLASSFEERIKVLDNIPKILMGNKGRFVKQVRW